MVFLFHLIAWRPLKLANVTPSSFHTVHMYMLGFLTFNSCIELGLLLTRAQSLETPTFGPTL